MSLAPTAFESAPRSVRKWAQEFLGNVKAWMLRRLGVQAGAITPAQLRAMAVYALKSDGRRDSVPAGEFTYSRSATTKADFDKRIDELFVGATPSNSSGVRVLDRSDVLDLLGFGAHEVVLAEKHAVTDGMANHPEFTAEDWKKIPEWLDNPVAVFQRDDGHLTVIAPETKGGQPIIIGLSPSVESPGFGEGRPRFHVLLTAYNKDGGKMPIGRMLREGQLRYVDQRKAPDFNRDAGHQLPSHAADLRGLGGKLYTDADLFKYRQTKGGMYPRSGATEGYDSRVNNGQQKRFFTHFRGRRP